jgi:hypothetical protein
MDAITALWLGDINGPAVYVGSASFSIAFDEYDALLAIFTEGAEVVSVV